MKNVLGMDGGNSCTAIWMHWIPLNNRRVNYMYMFHTIFLNRSFLKLHLISLSPNLLMKYYLFYSLIERTGVQRDLGTCQGHRFHLPNMLDYEDCTFLEHLPPYPPLTLRNLIYVSVPFSCRHGRDLSRSEWTDQRNRFRKCAPGTSTNCLGSFLEKSP